MDPKNRKMYLNEINTCQDLLRSAVSQAVAASGLKYPELIERLIRLGKSATKRRKETSTAGKVCPERSRRTL